MTEIYEIAGQAIRENQNKHETPEYSQGVRKLFLMMHGNYGNSFFSKFATGVKDEKGKDKGIRAAMLIWDSQLREYDADVIEIAAKRAAADFPQFPPTLPQFEAICKAVKPRKTFAEENGFPKLPPPAAQPLEKVSFDERRDGKDWARRILAREAAGEKINLTSVRFAREALGIENKTNG